MKNAYNVLSEAVSGNKTSVDFDSEPDVYVKADITSDNPDLQASLNACNNFTKASITYTFGDETETLDGNTIKDWMIHLSDSTSQIMWRSLQRPMIQWELKESSRQQVGELSVYTVLHMDGR